VSKRTAALNARPGLIRISIHHPDAASLAVLPRADRH
jgi:hypothetical protein